MKKSEGVDFIMKVLSEFDENNTGFSYRMIAKHLLNKIEEKGFKPPYNSKGLSSYDIAMGSDVNTWEEESE